MTSKINELADKIYQEGVEKAELEAQKILSEAEGKAAQILNDSEQKAAKTIADATQKSKEIFNGIHDELNSLSNQVIAVTQQKITDCILTDASQQITNELLDDTNFVQSFFLDLVKLWENNTTSADDLVAQMSEEQLTKLQEFFKSKAYESLMSQPQIEIGKNIRKRISNSIK